ncbi:hypothetical protein BDZ97DRAFT_1925198 [Flammula alnicola]|nr:hypothetical protein BDZ97DRAFT_1925198 [Flammula alnicola]
MSRNEDGNSYATGVRRTTSLGIIEALTLESPTRPWNDYSDGSDLLANLEMSKERLYEWHYAMHYAGRAHCPPTNSSLVPVCPPTPTLPTCPTIAPSTLQNELDDYFNLPSRTSSCVIRSSARDILGIPRSAVAAERIFSGGRVTIYLCVAQVYARPPSEF